MKTQVLHQKTKFKYNPYSYFTRHTDRKYVQDNTHICMHVQACTHLFNFFTSPAQSQIFPLIERSSLFILLCCALQQLISSRAELHLEKTTTVSVLCLAVCVFLVVCFKWNSGNYLLNSISWQYYWNSKKTLYRYLCCVLMVSLCTYFDLRYLSRLSMHTIPVNSSRSFLQPLKYIKEFVIIYEYRS